MIFNLQYITLVIRVISKMTIDLHNPSVNSENHTEIRIGNYKNIMAYGSAAGSSGFDEKQLGK